MNRRSAADPEEPPREVDSQRLGGSGWPLLLLLASCATAAAPVALQANHPAHPAAAPSPIERSSTTLLRPLKQAAANDGRSAPRGHR